MIYEHVDINSHKLKNLKSPVNAEDAATKQYVDNLKGLAFNAGNTEPQNLRPFCLLRQPFYPALSELLLPVL